MPYIRGKYAKAACSLIDHLRRKGVIVQVGYSNGTRRSKLVVFITQGNESDIPAQWNGLPIIIGDIAKIAVPAAE